MPDYFGNTLTDLQRGVTAGQEMDTRRRIAADQAATQLAIQKIVSAIEQQKANQQGQYQQGSLGVQNRQVDAGVQEAALRALFGAQQAQAQMQENALDRAVREKQIAAQFPSESSRESAAKIAAENKARDRELLIEEYNNSAIAAASRLNAQHQSRINAKKFSLDTARQSKAGEYFGLYPDSKAKATMDTELKRLEAAGWPDETKATSDSLSTDPDASKVIFDGKQFVPKTMRFSPSGAAPTTGTGGTDAIQQLFGTQTTTNAPAVLPAPAALRGVDVGRVRVVLPNGATGSLPETQLDAAMQRGVVPVGKPPVPAQPGKTYINANGSVAGTDYFGNGPKPYEIAQQIADRIKDTVAAKRYLAQNPRVAPNDPIFQPYRDRIAGNETAINQMLRQLPVGYLDVDAVERALMNQ